MTFPPIPSHSWIWTLTLMSGWAVSKPLTNSFWNWAETLSRISQTSMVVLPPELESEVSEELLQALSPAVITSTETPAKKRSFTVHLWRA